MRALNAAAVTALEGVWTADRVHAVGQVPASPVFPYAVVSVSSGATTGYRKGAASPGRSHRLVVQVVGRTAAEVGFGVEKADTAYLGKRLAPAGQRCTPARSEVSSPIIRDPDAGSLLTCTLTYTFASTPA